MSRLKSILFFSVFIFFTSPVFAMDNTSCCDQLRQEVNMLKMQQDKLMKELKQTESSDKKGFMSMEAVLDMLATKFPEWKDSLNKIKKMLDSLGQSNT